MPIKRKRESLEQRRYTRGSMKKRIILRRPAHLGLILAILLGMAVVAAAALLWGSYLKEKSDAFRDSVQNGEWTLDEEMADSIPVDVPSVRAHAMWPQDSVGSTLVDRQYDGVILQLNDPNGDLYYASSVAGLAGKESLLLAANLSADVANLKNRGFYVICTYTVTCFEADDPAIRAYLRGLDLALLASYAEAGMDDLLLLGLPAGSAERDADTIRFLQELSALLAERGRRPAVGVALPVDAFASEEGTDSLYAGNLTPGRILTACDYLAMDLTDVSEESTEQVLSSIRYAYVRYSLRLLMSQTDQEGIDGALAHGFERLLEIHVSDASSTAS